MAPIRHIHHSRSRRVCWRLVYRGAVNILRNGLSTLFLTYPHVLALLPTDLSTVLVLKAAWLQASWVSDA